MALLKVVSLLLLVLAIILPDGAALAAKHFEKEDETAIERSDADGDDFVDGGDDRWGGLEEPDDPDMEYGDENEEDMEGEGEEEGEEGNEMELPPIDERNCFRPAGTQVKNIKKFISFQAPLSNGGKLYVLDQVFTKDQAETLRAMFPHKHTNWVFTGFDPAEDVKSSLAPRNNAPWLAMVPSQGFSGTTLWQHIRGVVDKLFPSEHELKLASVTTYILKWGDQLQPDLGAADDDSLVAHIYLDQWKRNFYGETLLFNSTTLVGAGIHPRPGRLAVFSASTRRLLHPPAIDYTSAQHLVELRMTRTSEKDALAWYKLDQDYEADIALRMNDDQKKFFSVTVGKNSGVEQQEERNPGDQIIKRYVSSADERVSVFDDALDSADVMKLRRFMLTRTVFQYAAKTVASGAASWNAALDVQNFQLSRLSVQLQRVVDFFTDATTYYPYYVSGNIVRAADMAQTLQDCLSEEDDITVNIYLNPNWTQSLYGETIFFEKTKTGQLESTVAVRPRFGRVVVYDGKFMHSARPPSPVFQGARLTLTVRYAASRDQAILKKGASGLSEDEIDRVLERNDHTKFFKMMYAQMESVAAGVGKQHVIESIKRLQKRAKSGEKVPGREVKDVLDDISRLTRDLIFHGM